MTHRLTATELLDEYDKSYLRAVSTYHFVCTDTGVSPKHRSEYFRTGVGIGHYEAFVNGVYQGWNTDFVTLVRAVDNTVRLAQELCMIIGENSMNEIYAAASRKQAGAEA